MWCDTCGFLVEACRCAQLERCADCKGPIVEGYCDCDDDQTDCSRESCDCDCCMEICDCYGDDDVEDLDDCDCNCCTGLCDDEDCSICNSDLYDLLDHLPLPPPHSRSHDEVAGVAATARSSQIAVAQHADSTDIPAHTSINARRYARQ